MIWKHQADKELSFHKSNMWQNCKSDKTQRFVITQKSFRVMEDKLGKLSSLWPKMLHVLIKLLIYSLSSISYKDR